MINISITFIIGPLWPLLALLCGVSAILHYPDDGGYAGFEMLYCGGYRRIGNIKGAVLGGFILGLGEILIVAFFPQLSGYRDAFAFIVLIVILFYKPTGLLGEKTTEKV